MRSPNNLRGVASLRHSTLGAAACALLLATSGAALAGACGDSVDGRRVACACGDNVVADTILSPADPVVTEPCSGDGLTIVASPDADGITLHLAGQSIRGRGFGTGIRVARGGKLGATIVGGDEDDTRAEIANFATGIRASGRDVLREIRSIDVHGNTGDGLYLRASGASVVDVRSENNGRSGIALSGHGNRTSGVTASNNARDGLKVRGSDSTIDAKTTDNARNGATVGGRGNRVEELHAGGNAGAGLRATGRGNDVGSIRATGNRGGDVAATAGAIE